MARLLIALLLACVTTTNATSLSSPLTVAKVDADVRVPNASFAKKVNTAVLQVHTPGPSFLLFGFPKCGTQTLWDWITQHPKIKGKGESSRGWIPKEIHSLDKADLPRGEGQVELKKQRTPVRSRGAGGTAPSTEESAGVLDTCTYYTSLYIR